MTSFGADLRRFRVMTNERLERIVKASATQMFSKFQLRARGVTVGGNLMPGRMPVASSALVTSLTFVIADALYRGEFAYDIAMAKYKIGDPIRAYWDQPYSRYIEHGDENFAGWHYVGANAPEWPDIVYANARRFRNRKMK